jgi:8-oxo-dGTP diphosphatase
MSDFLKKLRDTPFSELIRNGFDAFDMPNWVKTRGGWQPLSEFGKHPDAPLPVLIFAVRLILEADGKVLFLQQTEKNGGRFALPGGNVEEAEFARQALCREANEELGVLLVPEQLTLAHVLHRIKKETKENFVVFYFRATQYKGAPENQEPKKFTAVHWFSWDALPENLSKHTRKILTRVQRGDIFSELPKVK